jgi:pSer/pThr/pTyr-binding forkhead associated (FHA) protein
VITCPKCGKDNQDHYKFCLGCGAELPRDAAAKQFTAPTTTPVPTAAKGLGGTMMLDSPTDLGPQAPGGRFEESAPPEQPPAAPIGFPSGARTPAAPPGGDADFGPTPGGSGGISSFAKEPVPEAQPDSKVCPQCTHVNPGHLRFCMNCGFNLASVGAAPPAAPPAAPQPAYQPPPPAAAEQAMGGDGGHQHVAEGKVICILTALRADKTEAGSFPVTGTCTLGRDTGGIFAGDSYLSPKHATFRVDNSGHVFVKDESSLNGTFAKLTPQKPMELAPGDTFRIGQEIIRFEPLTPAAPSPDGVERLGSPSKGYVGRICLIIGRDVTGNSFPVPEGGIHLGRERGDVVFPEDGYVSGLHCQIKVEGKRVFLTDLGSSNGTFLRLKAERQLHSHDEILMGQQLFRVTFPLDPRLRGPQGLPFT